MYSSAGDTLPNSLGGYFSYNNYFHSAAFSELPGVPNCCPRFGNTSGSGFSLGGFYDLPLEQKLSVSIRAGLSFIAAGFGTDEHSLVAVDGSEINAVINHELDVSVAHLDLKALAKYNIVGSLNLFAGIGFGIGIGSSYSQKETLKEPMGGTFENGLRTRNEKEGKIGEISFFVPSLIIGASYDLPLNKSGKFFISPEVSLNLGIGRLVPGIDWKAGSFNIGFTAGYRIYDINSVIPLETRKIKDIDTMIKESESINTPAVVIGFPLLRTDTVITLGKRLITELYRRTDTLYKPMAYSINPTVKAVPSEGPIEYPDTALIIEEMAILSFVPILNYIFFDENSAQIPNRYILMNNEQADSFVPESISQSGTLNVYYNSLNIIGYRLRNYPEAGLTVTGCNSNRGSEKNNKAVSKSRAQAVADYFIDTWRISPTRIKIENRNLPENASSMESQEGMQENQRVELSSDNPELLMPLIGADTARAVFPQKVLFKLEWGMTEKIDSWSLMVTNNGIPVKEFKGNGKPPETLAWNINNEKNTIPGTDGDIAYFLEAKDRRGMSYRSPMGTLRQERYFLRKHIGSKIIDKKVENFSLILFEFDTKRTNATNKRILDFIKSRLDKGSKVLIEGYTDNLGSPEYNLKLSEDRARSVSKYIDINGAEVKGLGNSSPFYDNKLPEGRFYNRTVIIIVETPIQKGE